jgi:hypothetical protein
LCKLKLGGLFNCTALYGGDFRGNYKPDGFSQTKSLAKAIFCRGYYFTHALKGVAIEKYYINATFSGFLLIDCFVDWLY